MSLGYASKGVAGAGLGLGIAGTTLGVINSGGLLGGLGAALGGGKNGTVASQGYGCWATPFVTQGELSARMAYQEQLGATQAELAKAQGEVAMLKQAEQTDKKISDTYVNLIGVIRQQDKELQAQIRQNELRLNQIDINMQRVSDGVDRVFDTLNNKIDCCCDKLGMAINQEAERRACADNTIVTYTNSTFQPNIVARTTITGGTVGTATGAEATYNPLKCSCNCNTSAIMTPTATPAA